LLRRALQRLLIGDRRRRAVNFGQANAKSLGVAPCPILEHADCHGLAQLDRGGSVAAPMDAGVDSMTQRDVVRDFVQLAVHRDLSCISTCIGLE
jgi:hypothetical protein